MNILFIGASGKTGKIISADLKKDNKIFPVDLEHTFNISNTVEVAIDFSTRSATMNYVPILLSQGIPCIIGTTGLTDDDVTILKSLTLKNECHCRICSNFDPTFNSFLLALKSIQEHFAKAQIEEWHHKSKLDIPSGSALTIKEYLNKIDSKIISHRCEQFIYKHQVTFINSFTEIRMIHEVKNKKIYATGVRRALKAISCPGFYNGL